jgi:thioredoxin reductase
LCLPIRPLSLINDLALPVDTARIENYLGFPTGISGMALMARAYNQAHKFGVETTIPSEVVGFDTQADSRRAANRSAIRYSDRRR